MSELGFGTTLTGLGGSTGSGSSHAEQSTQMVPGMMGVYSGLLSANQQNYGNMLNAYQQGQSNLGGQLPGVYGGYSGVQGNVMNTLGMGQVLGQDGNWGVAAPAAQAIGQAYQQNQANTTQQMTNAGLGNTTAVGSAQNQNTLGAAQAYGGLGAQLAQTAAGYQAQIGQAQLGARMQGLGMQTGLTQGALSPMNQQFSNTAGSLTGGFGTSSSQQSQRAQQQSQQPDQRGQGQGANQGMGGNGNPYNFTPPGDQARNMFGPGTMAPGGGGGGYTGGTAKGLGDPFSAQQYPPGMDKPFAGAPGYNPGNVGMAKPGGDRTYNYTPGGFDDFSDITGRSSPGEGKGGQYPGQNAAQGGEQPNAMANAQDPYGLGGTGGLNPPGSQNGLSPDEQAQGLTLQNGVPPNPDPGSLKPHVILEGNQVNPDGSVGKKIIDGWIPK